VRRAQAEIDSAAGGVPSSASFDICDALTWSSIAARWWYVLRYYRGSQLAMRLVDVARRAWSKWNRGAWAADCRAEPPALRNATCFARMLRWTLAAAHESGTGSKAQPILQGQFTFLNQTRTLPDPIDWRLSLGPRRPQRVPPT